MARRQRTSLSNLIFYFYHQKWNITSIFLGYITVQSEVFKMQFIWNIAPKMSMEEMSTENAGEKCVKKQTFSWRHKKIIFAIVFAPFYFLQYILDHFFGKTQFTFHRLTLIYFVAN